MGRPASPRDLLTLNRLTRKGKPVVRGVYKRQEKTESKGKEDTAEQTTDRIVGYVLRHTEGTPNRNKRCLHKESPSETVSLSSEELQESSLAFRKEIKGLHKAKSHININY